MKRDLKAYFLLREGDLKKERGRYIEYLWDWIWDWIWGGEGGRNYVGR